MKKKYTEKRKNVAIEDEEVNLGIRFLSYLIDWYVGALCTAIPISLISQKLTNTMLNQNIIEFEAPYGIIAGILAVMFAFFYFVIVPTYITKGQTFGKKICKLKIVQKSNEDITLKNMILRQVVGIIILEGVLVTASSIWHQIASIITQVNFVSPLMYVGFVITAISIFLVVSKPERRAIHDYLGNTKVVKHIQAS